jgi:hypothetical protein
MRCLIVESLWIFWDPLAQIDPVLQSNQVSRTCFLTIHKQFMTWLNFGSIYAQSAQGRTANAQIR